MPGPDQTRRRPGAAVRFACGLLTLAGLILALGCGKEPGKTDDKGPKDNVPKRMPK